VTEAWKADADGILIFVSICFLCCAPINRDLMGHRLVCFLRGGRASLLTYILWLKLLEAPALAMRTSSRPNRSSVACTAASVALESRTPVGKRLPEPPKPPHDHSGCLIKNLLRTPRDGHICTSHCVLDGDFLSDATRCACDEYNFAMVCLVLRKPLSSSTLATNELGVSKSVLRD